MPRSILLSDYPFFNSLITQTLFDGASDYNGLNLKVQKRYSHGLNFIAAYTFSKKINNAAVAQLAVPIAGSHSHVAAGLGWRAYRERSVDRFDQRWSEPERGAYYQDPDNEAADRRLRSDDITHMFNIAASYDLPIGQGKALLQLQHGREWPSRRLAADRQLFRAERCAALRQRPLQRP